MKRRSSTGNRVLHRGSGNFYSPITRGEFTEVKKERKPYKPKATEPSPFQQEVLDGMPSGELVGAGELAHQLDKKQSSVYGALMYLKEKGYVEKDGSQWVKPVSKD